MKSAVVAVFPFFFSINLFSFCDFPKLIRVSFDFQINLLHVDGTTCDYKRFYSIIYSVANGTNSINLINSMLFRKKFANQVHCHMSLIQLNEYVDESSMMTIICRRLPRLKSQTKC